MCCLSGLGNHALVALLAEGVDRNYTYQVPQYCSSVALLAEGVDRNDESVKTYAKENWSPSSRRAWIEIL